MNHWDTVKKVRGIYKVTNKVNGKVYIGQSVDIGRRWRTHMTAKDDIYFHKAIQKYGVENFEWEVIEQCKKSELDEREIYWIEYYDSFNKGYNCTKGGDGVGIGEDHPNWKGGPEYRKEYKKQYYEANKEQAKHQQKQRYEINKEQIKEKAKERSKEYYQAHKEQKREYDKQHYETNKEELKKKQKEYYETNKDKIREYNRQRYEAHKEELKEKAKQRYLNQQLRNKH